MTLFYSKAALERKLDRWRARLDPGAHDRSSPTYVSAEIVDTHVELAGSLAWLGSLLDRSGPRDGDQLRWHRARSNAAVEIAGDMDDHSLAQRLVATTQLAEHLDTGTLELALKIVPVAWWEARLGTTAHADDGASEANGDGPHRPARRPP